MTTLLFSFSVLATALVASEPPASRGVEIPADLGAVCISGTGTGSETSASEHCREDVEAHWRHRPMRARAGDDPSFASPSLDDSGWAVVSPRLLPGTRLEGWQGIGWFRLWVELPPELAGRPLALQGRWVGAAEVFVDGVKQLALGEVSAVQRTGSTPVEFRADRVHWLDFSGPGRHLIAVRFASNHVEALQRVGFPGGFELTLSPVPAAPAPGGGGQGTSGFIGATVALALLHLLLFLFHRARREHLHHSLAALSVAAIAASQAVVGLASTASQVVFLFAAFHASIVISAVLLLRFYHALFTPTLTRWFYALAAAGGVLVLAASIVPRWVVYTFAGLVFLEQTRVLVTAVARRISGAWILAVGGALWLAGAALQMLGDSGLLPFFPQAYLYGFLALLGSSSIYLARDIARDKEALARKLVEIEKLSELERQAKERYRTLFEATGTGMISFGQDGVISLANDEWSQLTGYSRAEVEGSMAWTAFFTGSSREKLLAYQASGSAAQGPEPRTFEAQLSDRKGRVHDGVITVAVVPGGAQRVGSFLDLSDLKRAQRQMYRADKMAALGQIIAGVAHEINNPNNFIHFNLPILKRYVEAMRPHLERRLEVEPGLKILDMPYEAFLDDLFKLLENMEHGSQRITAIVADLRHYIRGGEDAEHRPGSVAAVVDRVMALVGKQVRKLVKQLDVVVAEGLPLVSMNAGKIEQVLINLVINAGQAANKGQSWVKLSVRATEARDGVELRVEDNGTGIAPENLEQIFEPFFTSKGRDTGTGLGLSISQQIVEEHGGRISVASELGQGSCFTVWLPAVSPRA